MDPHITHTFIKTYLLNHAPISYDVDSTLPSLFWSKAKKDVEIYKDGLSPTSLGVRALSEIPKEYELGTYAGTLIPVRCGWNSCGLDRKLIVNIRKQTLTHNESNGIWYIPRHLYGPDYSTHINNNFLQTHHIDAYINGNWSQFINSSSRPNCRFTQTGKIITLKKIPKGHPLTIQYYSSETNVDKAQQYILSHIIPPSISSLSSTIWIYPCMVDVQDMLNTSIIVTSNYTYYSVLFAIDNESYPTVFVPELSFQNDSAFLSLTCQNLHSGGTEVLKWKIDINSSNTICNNKDLLSATIKSYIDATVIIE